MTPEDQIPPAQQSSGEPKRERYNTQFLVAKMGNEERRAKLIILVIAIGTMLAIGIGVMLTSKKPEPIPEAPAGAIPHNEAKPRPATKP